MTISNQEALDILVNAKLCRNSNHEKQLNEAIEMLQELVDKATPKKVKERFKQFGLPFGKCPNCDEEVYTNPCEPYDYCPSCGQALEWDVYL